MATSGRDNVLNFKGDAMNISYVESNNQNVAEQEKRRKKLIAFFDQNNVISVELRNFIFDGGNISPSIAAQILNKVDAIKPFKSFSQKVDYFNSLINLGDYLNPFGQRLK